MGVDVPLFVHRGGHLKMVVVTSLCGAGGVALVTGGSVGVPGVAVRGSGPRATGVCVVLAERGHGLRIGAGLSAGGMGTVQIDVRLVIHPGGHLQVIVVAGLCGAGGGALVTGGGVGVPGVTVHFAGPVTAGLVVDLTEGQIRFWPGIGAGCVAGRIGPANGVCAVGVDVVLVGRRGRYR